MRDADAPKRPQTAFFLWMNEVRPELKKKYPELSVTEIAKKAGEKWKEVTDKSKWEEMVAEQKAEYEAAMVEYKKRPLKEEGSSLEDSPDNKPKKTKAAAGSKSSGKSFTSKDYISDDDSSDSDVVAPEDDSDDEPLGGGGGKKKEEPKKLVTQR